MKLSIAAASLMAAGTATAESSSIEGSSYSSVSTMDGGDKELLLLSSSSKTENSGNVGRSSGLLFRQPNKDNGRSYRRYLDARHHHRSTTTILKNHYHHLGLAEATRQVKRECDPLGSSNGAAAEAVDADVGIIECGIGMYCKETPQSSLGGYCLEEEQTTKTDHFSRNDFVGRELNPAFCSSEEFEYMGCNCDNFDATLGTGEITGCSTGHYNECMDFFNNFDIRSPESYSLEACMYFEYQDKEFQGCVFYDIVGGQQSSGGCTLNWGGEDFCCTLYYNADISACLGQSCEGNTLPFDVCEDFIVPNCESPPPSEGDGTSEDTIEPTPGPTPSDDFTPSPEIIQSCEEFGIESLQECQNYCSEDSSSDFEFDGAGPVCKCNDIPICGPGQMPTPSPSPRITPSPSMLSTPTTSHEEDCFDNITRVIELEERMRGAELDGQREYVLCPNKEYRPAFPFENRNKLEPNRNVLFKCGNDGSIENNCTFMDFPIKVGSSEETPNVAFHGIEFVTYAHEKVIVWGAGDVLFENCSFNKYGIRLSLGSKFGINDVGVVTIDNCRFWNGTEFVSAATTNGGTRGRGHVNIRNSIFENKPRGAAIIKLDGSEVSATVEDSCFSSGNLPYVLRGCALAENGAQINATNNYGVVEAKNPNCDFFAIYPGDNTGSLGSCLNFDATACAVSGWAAPTIPETIAPVSSPSPQPQNEPSNSPVSTPSPDNSGNEPSLEPSNPPVTTTSPGNSGNEPSLVPGTPPEVEVEILTEDDYFCPNNSAVSTDCGEFNRSSGLWYNLTGNGNDFQFSSSCSEDFGNLTISFLVGSCDTMACVTQETFGSSCVDVELIRRRRRIVDDATTPLQNDTVTLSTDPGTAYYVLVQGADEEQTGSSFPFPLNVVDTGTTKTTPLPTLSPSRDPTSSPSQAPSIEATSSSAEGQCFSFFVGLSLLYWFVWSF